MTSRILPIAGPAIARRHIVAILRRYPRSLAVVLSLYALSAIAGLLSPWLLGGLVQSVVDGTTTKHVSEVATELFGCIVVQSVVCWQASLYGGRLGQTVLADFREEFIDDVLDLPLSVVEQAGPGDLLSRSAQDVGAIGRTVQFAVPVVMTSVSVILLTLVAMLFTAPGLSIVMLTCVPPIYLVTRWYLARAASGYLEQSAMDARLTEELTASVEGAHTVEAFGLGPRRVAATEEAVVGVLRASRYTLYLRSVFFPTLELAYALPMVSAVFLGAYFYSRGWSSLAAATTTVLYCQQLISPLSRMLEMVMMLQRGKASVARVIGVGLVPPDRSAGAGGVRDPRELRGDGVVFGYDADRDAVRGIDIRVKPGERLAVVGPSGAGKSTLGRLMAGIYVCREGTVRLGGARLVELPLDELRAEIVLVSQESHVFVGTLRENLALAARQDVDADDSNLWAALESVGAADWARGMPEGLDVRLGSGGEPIGEARSQELALARLLIADPSVVILDEATSAFDPGSARDRERLLSSILKGRTLIAIAHGMHTARDADRVAVVDDGLIVETGSHDELVLTGGAYARLWAAWHDPSNSPVDG